MSAATLPLMLAAASIRIEDTMRGIQDVNVPQYKKTCTLIWSKRTLKMHNLQFSLSLSLYIYIYILVMTFYLLQICLQN
jgi:hypothetical protein